MRWRWRLLMILMVLLLASPVGARGVVQGDNCVIPAGDSIEGDVFVLCRVFVLNGQIDGNLIGLAFDAELRGSVTGNVYMIAGQLDSYGRIGRDLLFAGPALRLHPGTRFSDPRGALMSLSLSSAVQQGVRVPGSVTSLGYQLELAGDVGREVNFWGSALQIEGHVAGDIDAAVGSPTTNDLAQWQSVLLPLRFDIALLPPGLVVTEDAQVDGLLSYRAPGAGQIDGTLAQPPMFERISITPDFSQLHMDEESTAASLTTYLARVLREFINLGVIGLLILLLLPRQMQAPVQQLQARPLPSLGFGLLALVLSVVLWLIVLVLLILALSLFLALNLSDLAVVSALSIAVLNLGGAGVLFVIIFYISRIVACLLVGRYIVRLSLGDDGTPRMIYFNLAAGLVLLAVLAYVPLVGGVVNALALLTGLGAIFLALTQRFQRMPRRVPVGTGLARLPDAARQIPPPPLTERELKGPGMDNLPEGFRWWPEDD